MNKKYRTIVAIADKPTLSGNVYTEEALRKAAELHKDLTIEKTKHQTTLVWTGAINNEEQKYEM